MNITPQHVQLCAHVTYTCGSCTIVNIHYMIVWVCITVCTTCEYLCIYTSGNDVYSYPSLAASTLCSTYLAFVSHCRERPWTILAGSGLLCKHPRSLLLHPGPTGEWDNAGVRRGKVPKMESHSHDLLTPSL